MSEFDQLTELLTDISFPVTKEQLLLHARTQGAQESTLDDLHTLPNREYADLMDVWNGLGAIRSIEAEPEEIESEETQAPPLTCPHCQLRFSDESGYRTHMRDEHGEDFSHLET